MQFSWRFPPIQPQGTSCAFNCFLLPQNKMIEEKLARVYRLYPFPPPNPAITIPALLSLRPEMSSREWHKEGTLQSRAQHDNVNSQETDMDL